MPENPTAKPIVYVVEDDNDLRKWYQTTIHTWKIADCCVWHFFEDIAQAGTASAPRPDFVVLDLQTMPMVLDWQHITAPIKSLVSHFPRAIFVIYSGVASEARQAVDEIREEFEHQDVACFAARNNDPREWYKRHIAPLWGGNNA